MNNELVRSTLGVRGLPYPDMRGRIDMKTRLAAEHVCYRYGYTVQPDVQMEDADIVAVSQDGQLVLIDVERSSLFKNGVYYSTFNAVTIPIRKSQFLQHRCAFWMCLDRELEHFIVLKGTDILRRSRKKEYANRLNKAQTEFFLAMAMDQVCIIPLYP